MRPIPSFSLAPLLLLTALTGSQAAVAQGMIAGCRLVGADLQCVPGLTTTPEQQIQIMQGQISADTAMEGVVDQQITGLSQLLLQGETAIGSVLTAQLIATTLATLSTPEFHWYVKRPGESTWILIPGAQGGAYTIKPADAGSLLMVVAVTTENGQVKREASPPLGPLGQ
ncbi:MULTISPECIES: hypothetical protein [Synechococcales]|uniref:hypothetical protein n=1 Tax=Synechococcus sp. CS-1333 TaxID=2848638 RepID=UPI00223A78C9|nr:hypothetical protein [Synechococcus sp. CS-1333]